MAVGSLYWGWQSDIIGRKRAFNLTLMIAAVFGTATALAPTYWLVLVGVFLLGAIRWRGGG